MRLRLLDDAGAAMSRPMYAMPSYEMTAEDRAEEAAERRAEYIEDFYPDYLPTAWAAEGFAQAALHDLPDNVKESLLLDLARFFERYHALADDDTTGAMVAGRELYNEVKLQLEPAAEEKARELAAAEYDEGEAA